MKTKSTINLKKNTHLQKIRGEEVFEVVFGEVMEDAGVGNLKELLCEKVMSLARGPLGTVRLLAPAQHADHILHAQVVHHHVLTTWHTTNIQLQTLCLRELDKSATVNDCLVDSQQTFKTGNLMFWKISCEWP